MLPVLDRVLPVGLTCSMDVDFTRLSMIRLPPALFSASSFRGLHPELLGQALWRQRLLERTGWIVLRIPWWDWIEATNKDGGRGDDMSREARKSTESHKYRLLHGVLTRSGVV